MSGTLYLVATPIGNLEDITLRAIRILRDEASVIACEDTRQTQKLLNHLEIRKPLLSYHEHNEQARADELVQILERGESVALVSDAGTPLISDPGYRVVSACSERGIAVVPLPGPAAFVAALSASGLPTDQFRFLGFLPAKAGARRRFLESVADEDMTMVAYESPYRIIETLADIQESLGERGIAVAREISKLHEEFLRGSVGEVRSALENRPAVKGEFTIVLSGVPAHRSSDSDPVALVRQLQATGLSSMQAIKTAAKQLNLPKRQVYRAVEEADSN